MVWTSQDSKDCIKMAVKAGIRSVSTDNMKGELIIIDSIQGDNSSMKSSMASAIKANGAISLYNSDMELIITEPLQGNNRGTTGIESTRDNCSSEVALTYHKLRDNSNMKSTITTSVENHGLVSTDNCTLKLGHTGRKLEDNSKTSSTIITKAQRKGIVSTDSLNMELIIPEPTQAGHSNEGFIPDESPKRNTLKCITSGGSNTDVVIIEANKSTNRRTSIASQPPCERSAQMGACDNLLNEGASTDKTDNDTRKSDTELNPPDGGWGWVVCFACFMECFIFDGVFYSFGIILLHLTDYFDSDKESGAWISSVNFGLCMTTGPLISALCNKFGFRAVTIAGTLLTSLGLIMSSFANSLLFLYISYGFVAGFGYGMVYTPSTIAVTLYFSKKRSFATGLALCGNGLGIFAMSPLTDWLLTNYTWRGTFIVQSGLLLNGILCGLVYRPLVPRSRSKRPWRETKHTCASDSNRHSIEIVISEPEEANDCLSDINQEQDGFVQQIKTVNDKVKRLPYRIDGRTRFNARRLSVAVGDALMKSSKHAKRSFITIMIETFDMSLLKDVPFCIFTMSSALYSLAYYVPFLYVPDVAKHAGIDSFRGAWLLSSIGVSNIASRVLLGLLSDFPGVNRLTFYSVVVFMCGLVAIFTPIFKSFEILLSICILFGLFQGLSTVLMSVIVVDLLGTKDTCQGFGILNLFSGIATFVGTPFAGWMYDITAGFHVTFYVCGAIVSISGAMLFIHPCLKRSRRTKT